ncbi:hypothetical protein ScPMuIL_016685 [Solemya velum]
MSGQPSQRVRRNVSPSLASTKQGPLKAVKPYSLKNSPTRKHSPNSSPTLVWTDKIHKRRSPDSRLSPERRSPISPNLKVERPKAVRGSPVPPGLWRTNSMEAISCSYLKGQWPTDPAHRLPSPRPFMCDKTTQTSDDWESLQNEKSEKKKSKGHRRSASFGHGELQVHHIRQRLQKTVKDASKQRQSPVPGNHQALSVYTQSKAIGIPVQNIPKANMSRFQRNSVEGLSTEIEKIVLKHIPFVDVEDKIQGHEIPDGHRAPSPCNHVMRSVDTQTPSGCLEDNASPGSRSLSVSPAIPIIPGQMETETSRPSSHVDTLIVSPREEKSEKEPEDVSIESPKIISSPMPNKSYSFVREPPDGCEKILVMDETRKNKPSIKEPLLSGSVKPSHFVLKPSVSSAFCPLYNSYVEKPQEFKSVGLNTSPPPTSVESQ